MNGHGMTPDKETRQKSGIVGTYTRDLQRSPNNPQGESKPEASQPPHMVFLPGLVWFQRAMYPRGTV